jgi:hypothetical protein
MVAPPEIGEGWSASAKGQRIEITWISSSARFLCRWWVTEKIADEQSFVYPHEVMMWLRSTFAQNKLQDDQP